MKQRVKCLQVHLLNLNLVNYPVKLHESTFVHLQDLYRNVQHKKPQVNELMKRSEKFVNSCSEGNEEHVTGLRHLWRDVMLKVCSKLRDLQNLLHVVMMKALNVNNKEDFLKTLSECEGDVKDLLQRFEECCAVDTGDDSTVAAARYHVS